MSPRAGEHMACPGYTGPLSSSNPSSQSSGELVTIQEEPQTLNSFPPKVKALRNGQIPFNSLCLLYIIMVIGVMATMCQVLATGQALFYLP